MSGHDEPPAEDRPEENAPPSARVVITAGGAPTIGQLAALAVALAPVSAPDGQSAARSGWISAARMEAVGGRPAVGRDDLAGRHDALH